MCCDDCDDSRVDVFYSFTGGSWLHLRLDMPPLNDVTLGMCEYVSICVCVCVCVRMCVCVYVCTNSTEVAAFGYAF